MSSKKAASALGVSQTFVKFNKKFLHKKIWPSRSPDLNPCDYYLWGYLKSKVYNPIPKTLDDLKANIEREVGKIKEETLKKTFLNFQERCKMILTSEDDRR